MSSTRPKIPTDEAEKYFALMVHENSLTARPATYFMSSQPIKVDPHLQEQEVIIELDELEHVDDNVTKISGDVWVSYVSKDWKNTAVAGLTYHKIIDQGEDVSTNIQVQEDNIVLTEKQEIEILFDELISLGKEINFKQAMENDYTKGLFDIITYYEDRAIDALKNLIEKNAVYELLASDTLIWLGLYNNQTTHYKQLRTLIHFLNSPSIKIRYGAVIGLENLDNQQAIPAINRAIIDEQFIPLRMEMMDVVKSMAEEITDDYIETN